MGCIHLPDSFDIARFYPVGALNISFRSNNFRNLYDVGKNPVENMGI